MSTTKQAPSPLEPTGWREVVTNLYAQAASMDADNAAGLRANGDAERVRATATEIHHACNSHATLSARVRELEVRRICVEGPETLVDVAYGGLTIRELYVKDIFCAFIARGHRFEKARAQAIEQADLILAELAKPSAPDPLLLEAREIVSNFKGMVKQVPEFNHEKYDSFGRRVNNFLNATDKLVSP